MVPHLLLLARGEGFAPKTYRCTLRSEEATTASVICACSSFLLFRVSLDLKSWM
jgi:hypothetical protein